MKILICVTYLTGGGAERVATLWARGFVNEGHKVAVCLNTDKCTISYPVPDVVPVFNVYKKENRILKELGVGMAFRLRKIIKSYKPDVIIGVLPSWCKIIWMSKLGLNIPFIDTEHNAFERPKEAPMHWRERVDKFFFSKLADAITVLTDSDYNIIKNKRKNVFVLPNPLAFSPVEHMSPKENMILACGRLDVWYTKGFDLLIQAWGEIASSYKGWKLLIAGDGEKENFDYLKRVARNNRLDDGSFALLGRCEDMLLLYGKASIFVLSSRFEGFGMVLTEAMSQGCACIACDYKGRQAGILRNESEGIVIPSSDKDALREAIIKLIENDSLRKEYQEASIHRSLDYSLDRVINKWNYIFDKLIKTKILHNIK